MSHFIVDPINIEVINASYRPSKEKANEFLNVLVKTKKLLNDLGIPYHHTAYTYILYAVLIMHNNLNMRILSELYPTISDLFEVTPESVERNIRYTLDQFFTYGNFNKINKYFGNYLNYEKDKLSNKAFIVTLIYIIKEGEEQFYS